MKIIAVVFEDTVDISQIVKGSPASVVQGSNTLDGTVLVVADIYEPPATSLAHIHNTIGTTGPALP